MTRFASERASPSCRLCSSSSFRASSFELSASSSACWMLFSRASTASRSFGNATRIKTTATIAKQMIPQTSSAGAGNMSSMPEPPPSSWASTATSVMASTPLEDEREHEADQGQGLDQRESNEHRDAGLTGHLRLARDGLDRAREDQSDSDAGADRSEPVHEPVGQGLEAGVGEASPLLGQVDDRLCHPALLSWSAGAGRSRFQPFGLLHRFGVTALGLGLAVAVNRLGDVEGGQGREDIGLDADDEHLEDYEHRRDQRGDDPQRQRYVQGDELGAEQEEDREQNVARHHVGQESDRQRQGPDDEGGEDLDRRQDQVDEYGNVGRKQDAGEIPEPLLADPLEVEDEVGEKCQSRRDRHPRGHREIDQRRDLEHVHEEDEVEDRSQVVGVAGPVLGAEDVDGDLVAHEQIGLLGEVLNALRHESAAARPGDEEGYAGGRGQEHQQHDPVDLEWRAREEDGLPDEQLLYVQLHPISSPCGWSYGRPRERRAPLPRRPDPGGSRSTRTPSPQRSRARCV